jgi:hypothetical protein
VAQHFIFPITVRFKSESAGGMCLDLASLSSADAVYAIQAACGTGFSQEWKKDYQADGSYRLRSRYSDKCLALGGQYNALQQYTCSATATSQRFRDY